MKKLPECFILGVFFIGVESSLLCYLLLMPCNDFKIVNDFKCTKNGIGKFLNFAE